MSIIKYGFYAYGSTPSHCGEFIESAITQINKSGRFVTIESWKLLSINGKLLINSVLKAIDKADFFCADLTDLNENVLLELGFAIARRKPIWLTQDTSIVNSYAKFKELNFLTTVGYSSYTNSEQIIKSFFRDMPHNNVSDLISTLLEENDANDDGVLFFMKSQHDTNYNQYILNLIENYKIPVKVDDAAETKNQPLSWYVNQILKHSRVLIEFSSIYRNGFELQNAKCAFIAGIAIGLGLKVQMIAEKPFPTSLDYQEYLKSFTNLELCKSAITPFLVEIRNNLDQIVASKSKNLTEPYRDLTQLQRAKFGEFIAEHEFKTLTDYYVDTVHDEKILKSEYNIIVGRKGTGKTATLYYLESLLSSDVRNLTIPIKPVNFEIEGLIDIIDMLNTDFEKGFINQAIWKFLIYTEVAKFIYLKTKSRPEYSWSAIEKTIINYIEENESIFLTDFASRLAEKLKDLRRITGANDVSDFRYKLSEILHDNIIGKVKELVITYMIKKKVLTILIDNLDKNWKKGSNIEVTSKFILGLLSVIGRISKELAGSPNKPNEFSTHLVIFIRTDIFNQVLNVAREPDKIEFTRLNWSDPEILFRIVDRRIDYFSKSKLSTNFWQEFVATTVDGIPTKEFIMSCIIPRPRDLIYFLASAKNIAVSRGHNYITENDLKYAYEDYSNWIITSILVENGVTVPEMEKFLLGLLGEHSIVNRHIIQGAMVYAGLEASKLDYMIEHLCSLSFLGREIRLFDYMYESDSGQEAKIKVLADKLNTGNFKIHNAFIPYLECSDYTK